MFNRKRSLIILLGFSIALSGCLSNSSGGAKEPSLIKQVAERPPMGWNSFDAYDSRINEQQFKETVDYIAKELKPHGWEYAVIDYIWWHDDPGGYNTHESFSRRVGHPNERLNEDGSVKYPEYLHMDEFGRMLPSTKRFPSAKDGNGFKPIADYVHSKGLKFGIHIMRGIHRHAVYENTPIKNSNKRAADIAKIGDSAAWLNNTFGVEDGLEGSQEYYDSLFELYASWGVDFIKADDMMGMCGAPFYGYSGAEIEMMRKAIDRSGRPMVLSLSCGEAPIAQANHLAANSNMWRVSADFWDKWADLTRSFELLDKWSPFIQKNHWPDADMIPFGRLSIGDRPHGKERMSGFTLPEHYTLMTLFSIARSPLMIGADLLSTPQSTIDTFFKNDEVLAVNQESSNNRQVVRVDGDYAIWIATDPKTGDQYLAMFNLSDVRKKVTFSYHMEDLRGDYSVRDLWNKKNLGVFKDEISIDLESHGAGLYRLTYVPGSDTKYKAPKVKVIQNQ